MSTNIYLHIILSNEIYNTHNILKKLINVPQDLIIMNGWELMEGRCHVRRVTYVLTSSDRRCPQQRISDNIHTYTGRERERVMR